MKIVILDGYALNPGDLSWDGFKEFGELEYYDKTEDIEIIDRIGDNEIIIINKVPITKKVIDACPNLKYIGVTATGFDIVDIEYAKEKGIIVSNVPTYGTNAVAQYVFALILGVCHHVEAHSKTVYDGKWENSPYFTYWDFPLMELEGKVLGIIGYGKIGEKVAEIANAFNMKVISYNKSGAKETKNKVEFVSLDELYEKSDFISLHPYLTDENRGMINKDSIGKMKDTVIIVNTARGALVNEKDMAEALNNDEIYYYATDVVSREPIKGDNPLLKAKNCIITPHIAWATKEARQRLMDICVDNLKSYLDGKIINLVY